MLPPASRYAAAEMPSARSRRGGAGWVGRTAAIATAAHPAMPVTMAASLTSLPAGEGAAAAIKMELQGMGA